MEEEIVFIQEIPTEDKVMLLKGIENIQAVLEEEQGILEFSFYNPERTYPLTFLGEGNYGIVFQYKHYCIKYQKELYCDDIELEYESSIYLALQGIKELPTLYGYSDTFMIMEKIEGRDILKMNQVENKQVLPSQIQRIGQAILDKGYVPHDAELYLTQDGELRVLDVGLFEPYTDPSMKDAQLNVFCEQWYIRLGMYEQLAG